MSDGDGHTDGRGQPIGYNAAQLAPLDAAQLDAVQLASNSTLTASWQGGTVFNGFGQAPSPPSSAGLLGLLATS